jgi:aspartyl/asparaginyl-tRNA synthetase
MMVQLLTIFNVLLILRIDETLKRITTGAAVSVTGTLVESKGAGQNLRFRLLH